MDNSKIEERELFKGMYFDKQGQPIPDMLTFCRLWEDQKYKIIKQETIWPDIFISTVWLGLDHGLGNFFRRDPRYKPLIFETLVFPECDDMDRYFTEEEAVEGHRMMVLKYRIFGIAWLGYLCRQTKEYFKSKWRTE